MNSAVWQRRAAKNEWGRWQKRLAAELTSSGIAWHTENKPYGLISTVITYYLKFINSFQLIMPPSPSCQPSCLVEIPTWPPLSLRCVITRLPRCSEVSIVYPDSDRSALGLCTAFLPQLAASQPQQRTYFIRLHSNLSRSQANSAYGPDE